MNAPNYEQGTVMNLGEGKIEVTWSPSDYPIPEELEYLAERTPLPVLRTQAQSSHREDDLHLLFSPEGLWRGVRCRVEIWCVFMKSQGWTDANVKDFLAGMENRPKKQLRPA